MYDRFINWLTLKINRMNPTIFIVIVAQVILVVIIIIAISNFTADQEETTDTTNNNPSSHLVISNLNQQIPNLPQSGYEEIAFSIYDTAWLNRGDRELPTTLTSNIRENSTMRQYFEDLDLHQVHFLLDIPELQQTYQVDYFWSKDQFNTSIPAGYKTLVYCPTADQIVYPVPNDCIDRFAGTATNILQSLPH